MKLTIDLCRSCAASVVLKPPDALHDSEERPLPGDDCAVCDEPHKDTLQYSLHAVIVGLVACVQAAREAGR